MSDFSVHVFAHQPHHLPVKGQGFEDLPINSLQNGEPRHTARSPSPDFLFGFSLFLPPLMVSHRGSVSLTMRAHPITEADADSSFSRGRQQSLNELKGGRWVTWDDEQKRILCVSSKSKVTRSVVPNHCWLVTPFSHHKFLAIIDLFSFFLEFVFNHVANTESSHWWHFIFPDHVQLGELVMWWQLSIKTHHLKIFIYTLHCIWTCKWKNAVVRIIIVENIFFSNFFNYYKFQVTTFDSRWPHMGL